MAKPTLFSKRHLTLAAPLAVVAFVLPVIHLQSIRNDANVDSPQSMSTTTQQLQPAAGLSYVQPVGGANLQSTEAANELQSTSIVPLQ